MARPEPFTLGGRTYAFERTYVMGIVNVTPDSFSDGGKYLDSEKAVEHALQLVADGADILDIGGESSRPRGTAYGGGAEPVSEKEELRRILPVIRALAGVTDVPISVDTYKGRVAREALAAGATIVNDISGFGFDPDMPAVIAHAGASAVVMHMRGTPKTMQQNTHYDDLFGEIAGFLVSCVNRARSAGIRQVMVDPGIGFGKSAEDNVRLLAGLSRFSALGCPVLVGPSRKAFLGAILGTPVEDRLEGSIAACVLAAARGAQCVRVHDVGPVKRALTVADAIITVEG